jgi:Carboxypeptidase regulatory-like domain
VRSLNWTSGSSGSRYTERMIRPVIAFSVGILATCALAQSNRFGTISGVITDPDGAAVPNIPVQARNSQTGTTQNTSASGAYTFAQLLPGTYELLVPAVGFTLDKFEQKGLMVRAGQTVRANIKMPWGSNLGTPGDDPSLFLRNKYAGQSGRVSRTADGKPDFSGLWNSNDDPNPEEPSMLPWAAALSKKWLENNLRDNPGGFCLPAGPLITGPVLYRIVQTPALFLTLMEDVVAVRQVFLDGRGHPKDLNPTWMGHSIGHWEGDTLVIDTVGMNDKSWLTSTRTPSNCT